MATYGNLRSTIGGYMHRSAAAFIVDGVDMLLQAVNNAKNFCQRALDLEKAKVFCTLSSVSITDGKDLSNSVLFGTATPVVVKSVERTFLERTDASGQFPVDFISRDAYVSRMKRKYEEAGSRESVRFLDDVGPGFPLGVMQHGSKLYVLPASTIALGGSTVNIHFDALEWLADFTTTALTGSATSTVADQLVASGATFITSGVRIGDVVRNTTSGASALVTSVISQVALGLNGNIFTSGQAYQVDIVLATQTNFLLDFCFDYMLFRTMYELNFFLKEDLRVPISKTLLDEVWNNVVKWNATIIGNSVDDANLS